MKNIEKELRENKIYISEICGDSMEPMLKKGVDRVIIVPPEFPLKKYDVPVYRRNGHYTMHRIVKAGKNGYVICGDNRGNLERDVTDKDIIGVLSGFYHNGRYTDCTDCDYLKYVRKTVRRLPFRVMKYTISLIIGKITKNNGSII